MIVGATRITAGGGPDCAGESADPSRPLQGGDRTSGEQRWATALRVARLLAVDPAGLGGCIVRCGPGPAIDLWLSAFKCALAEGVPLLRMHPDTADDRLVGGLDLAATLATRRPVVEAGVLARAHGGVIVVPGAERMAAGTAARVAVALDTGAVRLARDGADVLWPARCGVIALDEGTADDDAVPGALVDRIAFVIDLGGLSLADIDFGARQNDCEATVVAGPGDSAARAMLPAVAVTDVGIAAICTAAAACGIHEPRAVILATRVARVIAALDGAFVASDAAIREACALVLAPRARSLPSPEEEASSPPPPSSPDDSDRRDEETSTEAQGELAERVVEAVVAAIPPGLLDVHTGRSRERRAGAGHEGARRRSLRRGRQVGVLAGEPTGGARLDILATLRTAAPWQRLRRGASFVPGDGVIEVRRSDFRVKRCELPCPTLTLFAVDASGSSALHRLGEAKGAIELLLADCYVRRDHVALLAFRGVQSDLVLPPTRSLARARKLLSRLPGGGGTPLAHALATTARLALDARRRGQTPALVLMTDCRANIALDGSGGRARAEQDALAAAAMVRATGLATLLVDTAPRPHAFAKELTAALEARYLVLPNGDPHVIAGSARDLVRAA